MVSENLEVFSHCSCPLNLPKTLDSTGQVSVDGIFCLLQLSMDTFSEEHILSLHDFVPVRDGANNSIEIS